MKTLIFGPWKESYKFAQRSCLNDNTYMVHIIKAYEGVWFVVNHGNERSFTSNYFATIEEAKIEVDKFLVNQNFKLASKNLLHFQ